jgi:hypothetical protein
MATTAPQTVDTSKTFCVNHPQTETYLRCNKCGKPVCMKCVERTPVGYRCKECLGLQRVGYYNATPLDYALAGIVSIVLGSIGGFVMGLIGGFFLIAIFAGPIGGGIIAEGARAVVQRHRGRYLWLIVCAAIVVGGLLGFAGLPLIAALFSGRAALVGRAVGGLFGFGSTGFLIYLALAVSTAYARLRV